VLSVTLFTFLPERLQVFAEYQFIVYGLILTFSLVVLPKGIGGLLLEPARFIKPRAVRRAAAVAATLPPAEGGGMLAVEGVTMRFGGLVALTTCHCDSNPDGSPRWSGRTGRARARWSTSSAGSTGRAKAG
jgi:hypothetical protein